MSTKTESGSSRCSRRVLNRGAAMAAVAFLACFAPTLADTTLAASFADKTITVATHSGAGGTYDLYARAFARHFGKFLPGNPTVVVHNQTGAGGVVSANHVGIVAPKDGSSLILMSMGLPMLQVVGLPGLKVSMRDFQWIGNLSRSNNVTAVWSDSNIKTLDDARKREVVFGVTGAGSIASGFPLVLNKFLGTRFKVISGYTSAAHMKTAMERGEIDGRGLDTWAGYKSIAPNEIKEGKLNILLQVGAVREQELPNIPLLTEVLTGTPEKESVARFITFGMTAGRPFAAPPGTSAEIVSALRTAFDGMIKDPAFLADATKSGAEVSPLSGAQVTEIMQEIYSTPKSTVEIVKAAMFEGQEPK